LNVIISQLETNMGLVRKSLFGAQLALLLMVLALAGCSELVSSNNPVSTPKSSAPTLTTQPLSQTVTAGQPATFGVVATGTAPLGYQWQKDGANISGATSASYTTPATTSGDNGSTFRVVVSNSAGSATSSAATLTVNPAAVAPTITVQPVNQTVTVGQTATFTVVATGTAPLGYQWQKDGANISGATSASYTTPATTSGDNGSTFAVAVSNSTGSITSNTATLTVNPSSGTGPLQVLASNPRYFTNDGVHAILLVGSHTWANGMEDRGTINPPLPFDNNGYMSFMKAHNFNWMRLWTTEMAQVSSTDDPFENIIGPPFKWQRSTTCCANDGGNKFDFTQLDQNYFDRMRSRVIQAGQNGIYVSVMLFNGYMWEFDETGMDGNPFETGNNVNSINCGGVCPSDNSQIPSAAWGYEQAYLQKVVDTVNDLPNVMYEVSNEAGSPYSDSWQASIISFVKQYEATKPFQHPVGMTFQYQGGSDSTLYNSQADWVSPSATLPPEAIGNKVVINDTDHSYCWSCMKSAGQNAQREWVWENFTRGNNLGFMDPYLVLWSGRNACSGSTADPDVCTTVDPYWNELRSAMTDVRNYATKIDLANLTPQHALSTSGYCLANPGTQYLVFSTSNSFTLTAVAGSYTFEWFNPSTHTLVQTGTMNIGSSQTFTAPFSGDAILWLHQ